MLELLGYTRLGKDCPAIELRQRLRCSMCRYGSANLHESARQLGGDHRARLIVTNSG